MKLVQNGGEEKHETFEILMKADNARFVLHGHTGRSKENLGWPTDHPKKFQCLSLLS